MKQVLIHKGQAVLEDVPSPQVEKGHILVQTRYSCISIGTEVANIRVTAKPIWKRALQEPQNVKKVFAMFKRDGFDKTRQLVKGKIETGYPIGYSASGIVIGVGDDIVDIKVGDKVACAGAQCAFHAEKLSIPRNLLVKVPDKVSLKSASTVTIGSIALQGVRRAKPTLGETFVVIGLGIIGQFTVQLLKANGCRVIVSDLDSKRVALALEHGADIAIKPGMAALQEVTEFTGGCGADGVIITAATKSDEVISTAFQMCRKKGRVVVVGDIGLNLKRADFYEKELDLFISSSYGPGRYDENYEEKGLDYPLAYVRWTENRNMQEIVRLLAENKLQVEELIDDVFPLAEATQAYETVENATDKPLIALFEYPQESRCQDDVIVLHKRPLIRGKIGLAVAGAGEFAKRMHLPNISRMQDDFQLIAVMNRTGKNAKAVANQFQADYATTNYDKILADHNVTAVLIATRHNFHAEMVLQALHAGKNVFVEKPLALNKIELDAIKKFYAGNNSSKPLLFTGFNRRYSPYMQFIAKCTKRRMNPLVVNYTMNAGYIPLNHWVHTEEGGGRNIGEACHIYDIFNFLTQSKVEKVTAHSVKPSNNYYSARDNYIATISYQDGSVCNLIYTAMGNKDYPKETMDVFFDGKMMRMHNFQSLDTYGFKCELKSTKIVEKGLKEEMKVFANALRGKEADCVPLWQQFQAMEIAFAVEKQLL